MRVVFWLVVAAAALPALLLTLCRLVDSDGGAAIRVEAFTPLGLPLYAFLLVLLLVGGLVMHSRGPLLAALVAAVGLALHAWWFSPQVLGDNPPPAPGADRVVVMNSNLFAGAGDPQDVVDAVRREGVDILVCEEITPGVLQAMDAAGLGELLPNRIGEPDPDVAGTMVFSNLPLGEPALLNTPFQSYRVQVGDWQLIAAHPTAPVLPRNWAEDHALILDEAEKYDVDLIVGDLNATPDHEPMRALDAAGWRDAGELANEGWQPTWPANHVGLVPFLPPVVRIDHVLLADTLASLGTHTVTIGGTDHLALVATIAAR